MNKKTLKIITIIATIIAILSMSSIIFAAQEPESISPVDVTAFDSIGQKVIGGIQAIGNIVSVGILIVIGIKYMMGSAEEKAEYKKVMVPYLIGAVLIFAAPQIAGMVYNFVQNNKG